MALSYIDRQVLRTNRNLLLVNGGVLALLLVFLGLMVVAGLVLTGTRNLAPAWGEPNGIAGQNAAMDPGHAEIVRLADLGSEDRLTALAGHTVRLTDANVEDMHFPVFDWMGRAGAGSRLHAPPTYHISRTGAGRALLIIPGNPAAGTTFIGVVRPVSPTDREPTTGMLLARGRGEQLLPYMLDCLSGRAASRTKALPVVMHPVGNRPETSTVQWLLYALIFGLPAWNVAKAVRRMKSPLTHPIYTQLAVYGPPLDVANAIEAERQRGVRAVPLAEMTVSWLMAPSFWGTEVVHLDHVGVQEKDAAELRACPEQPGYNGPPGQRASCIWRRSAGRRAYGQHPADAPMDRGRI